MGRLIALLIAAAALCLVAPAQKNQRSRPNKRAPDLELIELKIAREENLVVIEGTVKNISAKPIPGVVLYFEFLEPGGRMISRMKTEAAEGTLDVGEEAGFTTQTPDQVRATDVRVDAEDKSARYLIPDRPGPHRIE
jgi:hypothetical protein